MTGLISKCPTKTEMETRSVLLRRACCEKSAKKPNVLPIFGWEPKVPTLRIISLLVLALSVTGLVILGLQIQNLERNDRPAFVRMKYDALIVDIKSGSIKASAHIIDITSIDDLAKLAERYNVMILHDPHGSTHAYYVQGDGITYRYLDGEPNSKELAQ